MNFIQCDKQPNTQRRIMHQNLSQTNIILCYVMKNIRI